MTTHEALDHLTKRLVQAETDVRLLEDSADVAKSDRELIRKDLDIVISVLTKVVGHIHETKVRPSTVCTKKTTTKRKSTARRA